jgi:small subunit ribosomal protein MRP21
MELRRAADVLLRSQTSSLSSLLNPSVSSRWQAGAQLSYKSVNNPPAQRAFVTSSRNNALRPQPTTSATSAIPKPAKEKDSLDSIAELGKTLWTSPSSTHPRVHRSTSSLLPDQEKRMNGGDSAVDLLKAYNAARTPSSSSAINTNLMLDPTFKVTDSKSMLADVVFGAMAVPKTPRVAMRLRPSTGRSIPIGMGIDIGKGFRLLEQSCARNKVRSDFTAQRFHERPGLKRKRLRRQRWRKRFMEGFRATVGRVKQLRNQGW